MLSRQFIRPLRTTPLPACSALLFSLTLLLPIDQSSAAVDFDAPFVSIPVGTRLFSLAAGDLNADGHQDLVTADNSSNMLVVLLGRGNGTFLPPAFYPSGPAPGTVVLADFDEDGRLDIAVANTGTTLSVWLGAGGGNLGSRTDWTTPNFTVISQRPLAVADFDGDGNQDLLVNQWAGSPAMALLSGNGDGTFDPWVGVNAPVNAQLETVVADVNADGKPDLVIPTSDRLSLLLGNGNGTFGPTTTITTNNDLYYRFTRCAAVDLDADGRLDLVATMPRGSTGAPGKFGVLLGNGDGSFGARTEYGTGPGPSSLAIADLDADGRLDVATPNSVSTLGASLSVLRGRGDGTFDPSREFSMIVLPRSPVVADFDEDGRLDLAVVSAITGAVAVLQGNGDGAFGREQNLALVAGEATGGAYLVELGDLDGDGRLDVVGKTNIPSILSTFLGTGPGTFGARIDMPIVHYIADFVLGDLNEDSKLDMVSSTGSLDSVAAVWPGRGDGTFDPPTFWDAGGGNSSMVLGDFNGDGHLDLAISEANQQPEQENSVRVLLGNGDGTLGPSVSYETGQYLYNVASADLDLDGDQDLVLGTHDPAGSFSVLLGAGDGTFGSPASYGTPFGAYAAIGDLNHDGIPDVAANGTVSLGVGDGTFAAPIGVPAQEGGLHVAHVAIADVDVDGHPDVLEQSYGSGLFVHRGLGNGAVEPASMGFGLGSAPGYPEIADLDLDGRPDIVVGNGIVNVVSLIFNATINAPTAVTLSRASLFAGPFSVRIEWLTSGGLQEAVLRRSTSNGAWSHLATIRSDQAGRFDFEDSNVVPGRRYGYRLELRVPGEPAITDEGWVDVPNAHQLGLAGSIPNPARGDLVMEFTLVDRSAATLEVFDVGGRRVLRREVGALGMGSHRVALGSGRRLDSGLYFVRLTQRERSVTARTVVTER